MADEPNLTQPNPPSETLTNPPPANTPEARNPDGSLKQNPSLLTDKKEELTTKKEDVVVDPNAKDKKDEKKVESKTGVPEKYDFKAPEGFSLNDELVAKATPVFKELGLTQEQAQKLVDFYGPIAGAAETAPYDAYETMRNDWRKDVIASDLGNGKDGLKPEVSAVIGRAIDSLPAEVAKDFRQAMAMTGAGDNPAFIRAFHQLASKLGEGTLVSGSGPSKHGQTNSGRPTSPAQALYPNLPTNAR